MPELEKLKELQDDFTCELPQGITIAGTYRLNTNTLASRMRERRRIAIRAQINTITDDSPGTVDQIIALIDESEELNREEACQIIATWDVTKGAADVELTPEALKEADIPSEIFERIFKAIGAARDPKVPDAPETAS